MSTYLPDPRGSSRTWSARRLWDPGITMRREKNSHRGPRKAGNDPLKREVCAKHSSPQDLRKAGSEPSTIEVCAKYDSGTSSTPNEGTQIRVQAHVTMTSSVMHQIRFSPLLGAALHSKLVSS